MHLANNASPILGALSFLVTQPKGKTRLFSALAFAPIHPALKRAAILGALMASGCFRFSRSGAEMPLKCWENTINGSGLFLMGQGRGQMAPVLQRSTSIVATYEGPSPPCPTCSLPKLRTITTCGGVEKSNIF